jgi:hypothetical protein
VTLNTTTICITTFSINDIRNEGIIAALSIAHYYAECRLLLNVMLNVSILSVTMLNGIILSVVMVSVVGPKFPSQITFDLFIEKN